MAFAEIPVETNPQWKTTLGPVLCLSWLPVVDFTGPRGFRGNMVMLALRYAF